MTSLTLYKNPPLIKNNSIFRILILLISIKVLFPPPKMISLVKAKKYKNNFSPWILFLNFHLKIHIYSKILVRIRTQLLIIIIKILILLNWNSNNICYLLHHPSLLMNLLLKIYKIPNNNFNLILIKIYLPIFRMLLSKISWTPNILSKMKTLLFISHIMMVLMELNNRLIIMMIICEINLTLILYKIRAWILLTNTNNHLHNN